MNKVDKHVERIANLLALLKRLGTRGEKALQKEWGTQ
jgi:hypothetical protein